MFGILSAKEMNANCGKEKEEEELVEKKEEEEVVEEEEAVKDKEEEVEEKKLRAKETLFRNTFKLLRQISVKITSQRLRMEKRVFLLLAAIKCEH